MSKWLDKQKEQEERDRQMEENRRAAEEWELQLMNQQPAPAAEPTSVYSLVEGDTIWRVAQRFGYTVQDLADHNDIPREKWESVHMDNPAYRTLHLPFQKQTYTKPDVVYDIYPTPVRMHIKTPEGAQKYAFGNAEMRHDIRPTGPTGLFGKNLWIVAQAHVPLIADDGSDIEAIFYMDALAVGNFNQTGMVNHTIGYDADDLAEGTAPIVIAHKPLSPELQEKIDQAELERQVAETIAEMDSTYIEPIDVADDEAQRVADAYAETWEDTKQNLRAGGASVEYEALEDMMVKNLVDPIDAGKRFAKGRVIALDFTVVKDGELYGVPQKYADRGLWYGFPITKMMTVQPDEVDEYLDAAYSEPVDLQSRLALGSRVTPAERYVTIPLARALNNPWLQKQVDKLKNK